MAGRGADAVVGQNLAPEHPVRPLIEIINQTLDKVSRATVKAGADRIML
jgi:hypothetical protein